LLAYFIVTRQLFMMRKHKVLIAILAAAATVLIAIAVFWGGAEKSPTLVLNEMTTEPAGIIDDNGLEMRLVTVCILEPGPAIRRPEKHLFLRGRGHPIKAKVAGHWIEVDGMLSNSYAIFAGKGVERLIVLPANAVSCRFELQYTRARMTETQAYWLLGRLPNRMPFRQKIWFWLCQIPFRPSGTWRDMTMEVPLLPASLPTP